MDGISAVVSSPEYWFGATTALAFQDVMRRAIRHRLGLDSTDESDSN
jgi:hypothetical protein